MSPVSVPRKTESNRPLASQRDASEVSTSRRATCDVLHVPFGYFPDPPGGTEVYVAGLVAGLRRSGFKAAVAAPGRKDSEYQHNDTPVYRFACGTAQTDIRSAYAVPDPGAARSFATILARSRPKIVHLHARVAAVSELLADEAHKIGAKVILTYHTPTVSCVQGTMMRMQRIPCDGHLNLRRCTVCNLAYRGVPVGLRQGLAVIPPGIGDWLGKLGISRPAITALRMTELVGSAHHHFCILQEKLDHIVAVCDWVADVLHINGVANEKITVCRQGITQVPAATHRPRTALEMRVPGAPLRLGYFGRLDVTKGVDILIDAIKRIRNAPVQLDIFGICHPGSEAYAAELQHAAVGDARIVFGGPLESSHVIETMSHYDFVAVPSQWLETGPLVVFEAFAAGTPVLGARRGGISELVRDGVDGILVEPTNPKAWSAVIDKLARDPSQIARLRDGILPPRAMNEVAAEMAALYRKLLT